MPFYSKRLSTKVNASHLCSLPSGLYQTAANENFVKKQQHETLDHVINEYSKIAQLFIKIVMTEWILCPIVNCCKIIISYCIVIKLKMVKLIMF